MKIDNKTVHRNYKILEEYEAGIQLKGGEVKSIRANRVKLEDAYVKLMGNEPYVINMDIAAYQYARTEDYDPKRMRKLLLTKKELIRIQTKLNTSPGLTIVPLSCYNKGPLIKLKIALARGLKSKDLKSLEKKKEEMRALDRELKEYSKFDY